VKSRLKKGLCAVTVGVLLSGCGVQLQPSITKMKKTDREIYTVTADTDSTIAAIKEYGLKTKNYKYAFAMAAKLAKEKNYQYFSIFSSDLKTRFLNEKVKNVEEAYSTCTDETDLESFSWNIFSLNNITGKRTLCDSVAYRYPKSASGTRIPVKLTVELHNDGNRKNDYITFNTDEVLNASIIKELDMSKIEDIKIQ